LTATESNVKHPKKNNAVRGASGKKRRRKRQEPVAKTNRSLNQEYLVCSKTGVHPPPPGKRYHLSRGGEVKRKRTIGKQGEPPI